MRIFVTIITVALFAHRTCNLISMQWCSCIDRSGWVCRSPTSFRGRTSFPLF